MKAHWECSPDGNSYLKLMPESEAEMEQLTNVVIYAGTNDDAEPQDDTPEGFEFEQASAYGESKTAIYAVAVGSDGATMLNDKAERPDIEIRLWRKR